MKWKIISNILGGLFLLGLMIFAAYMAVPFVRYLSIPVTGGTEAPKFKEDPEMIKLKAANKANYFNTAVLGNQSMIVSSINDVPEQGGWINTAPLDLHAFAANGHVILVSFWNYSNINSYRAVPALEDLWKKYKGHGLVLVGVHSPQFEFEKNPANILNAVRDDEITYPVATDGEKQIWNKFGNYARPAFYIIDPQGDVVYTQFGEGNYSKLEQALRTQLQKTGWALPEALTTTYLQNDDKKVQTPTLYVGTGFLRRRLGNTQQPELDKTSLYQLPATLDKGYLYLKGSWLAKNDYLEAVSTSQVIIPYQANTIYLVLSQAVTPVDVEVQLDNAPIPSALRGKSIFERDGKTYMEVVLPGLYFPLKDNIPYGQHQLTLLADPGLRLYGVDFAAW